MQQRAHDAPHMGVIVDDEKAQAIEIDTNHAGAPEPWRTRRQPLRQSRSGELRIG
jgi:hypothetical protein